jgi:hypothetical protein
MTGELAKQISTLMKLEQLQTEVFNFLRSLGRKQNLYSLYFLN